MADAKKAPPTPPAAAAPAAADAAKAGAAKGKANPGNIITNLLIAAVAVVLITSLCIYFGMAYVAAIVVIGFLPGLSAYMVDRRPGKFASKAVMAFNFSGLLPQLAAILYSQNANNTAQIMFHDPMTWLWIYMFAAFGWLIIHLLPQITFLIFTLRADINKRRISSFQDMLLKEWGEEIKK